MKYNPDIINGYAQKSMGIDPGFGSSAFGVVVTQFVDGQIQIMHAEEYQRPDFNQMLSIVLDDLYIRKFKKNINNIFIDGANPSFIRALKIEIGENEEYEPLVERARKMKSDVSNYMQVIPVNFSSEHKAMLGNCKMLLEKDGGHIAVNPRFDKMITSLRTAVGQNEGVLYKEATSYDDVFDAFRLELVFYKLKEE
jgi:hypothetical protein